jgi:hypothetical protein
MRMRTLRKLQGYKCYIVTYVKDYENGQFSDVTFVTLLTFVTFLFDNLERGALPVTRRRTGKQRPDRLNGLAVAADNSAHVCLAQLHSKDRHLAGRNLGEHHLIRKFDELTNDEFEKLFHDLETIQTSPFVIPR